MILACLDRAKKLDARQTIYRSLAWYFDSGLAPPPKYHETFSYHAPNSLVAGKLVLLGTIMFNSIHADRANDPAVETMFQDMRNYCRQFINASPQIRGANWSFRLDNCVSYVLFTDNPSDMDEYQFHWNKAFSFNRWETESDGVHPDWSMMHHGDMNYWGMYGVAWTNRVLEYGELFADTPWAYKTEQLDFIANCMIEGVRWSLYRGNCEYTSAPKRGSFMLARTDNVAASFKELVIRLQKLGGGQLTRRADLEKLAVDLIMPPWSVEDGKVDSRDEFSGHRYFWTTEYQVHRRPDFAIYTRRCSQRIRPPENSAKKPGSLHLNYGTGYTPIMRCGDELRFSRLCWDFETVPGTTVEQGCTVSSGGAASTTRGLNLFSGGVDDGMYGCGAFDLQMVEFNRDDSGAYKYINGAGALKGTFFFDDGMVALGQHVRRIAPGEGKILTTLNNVMRQGEIVYSIDGASPQVARADTPLEKMAQVEKFAWVWHDEVGYVILGNTDLVLSCGEQPFNERLKTDGDFKTIVTRELGKQAWSRERFDMFRLWIDHGVNPQMQSYAYAVLPNCTAAELSTHAVSLSKRIGMNNDGIQAVTGEKVCYGVFSEPGTASFGEGQTITVDRPLIVMVRKSNDGAYVFHASNPEHVGLRRSYVPGMGPAVGRLYEQPVTIDVEGFGDVRSVKFLMSTERGVEGASVKGESGQ